MDRGWQLPITHKVSSKDDYVLDGLTDRAACAIEFDPI